MASPNDPIINSSKEDTSRSANGDDGAVPADGSNNVDIEANRRSQRPVAENQTDSIWKLLGKWVLALFIAAAVLTGMVFSTIFTFAIAKDLKNETRPIHGVHVASPKAYANFVALWLVLFLPSAFGFTRAVIKESLSSGQPWPKWKSIGLIVVVSLAEVFGLWIFTFHVLPDDHVNIPTALVLMNVVLVLHFAPHHLHIIKKNKIWLILLQIFAIVCLLVGLIAQVKLQNIPSGSPLWWTMPVSLTLLSIAWAPYIQLGQMIPRSKGNTREPSESNGNGNQTDIRTKLKNFFNKLFLVSENGNQTDIRTAHVRATILKNFSNMLFLVISLWVHVGLSVDQVRYNFTTIDLRRTEAMIAILPAFGGYLFGMIACSMCIQAFSFLFPLSLAPFATLLFAVHMDLCPWFGNDMWCREGAQAVIKINEYFYVISVALGQASFSVYNYVATEPKNHEKESNMFWFPQYTGIFTGQHMMLNRTKVVRGDQTNHQPTPENNQSDSNGEQQSNVTVRICTTMYRETWDEMSKYLESIKKVDGASEQLPQEKFGKFEAHVYFDNGVKESKLTDFSAQLVCLVKEIFKDAGRCTTEKTWYGWKLHWILPGSLGLPLNIHLKDTYNQKVKSKKRWSQVMYMASAVKANDPVKYILTTDGDVDFDADSIAAMLLQMLSDREEQVGAVCARTHPEGSGPFVWYQMFDYAIGHWLQKVANHVLGSVLCAPGCFSVYRVKAIADVLEEYRSDVEEASDFLTKDMGEDRWFTTLLVKAGYKINYCAAASDITHCPEDFDEFWKQRRRWIPSTLANQILLLKNFKAINEKNKYVPMVFILFQVILLFSTVISPSTCILILAGGLYYGLGVPPWLSLVVFSLLTLIFAVICMSYSQDTQLKVARIMCYIFLMSMAVAVVGTVSEMVLINTTHLPPIGRVQGIYDGCYLEYINSDDLLLPHVATPMKALTNSDCIDHCYHKFFAYSGTGHPAMCFCGSEDDMKNGTRVHEDMCTFPCPGDSTEYCGGRSNPGQISVYNINASGMIKLPLDVSTLYIAIVAGIHLIAALLHPGELKCILYGVVYLFTLPCVYILMNVYSLCNLTDQSWGTREAKSQQEQGNDKLSEDIMDKLRQFWTFCGQCCQRPNRNAGEESEKLLKGNGDSNTADAGEDSENEEEKAGEESGTPPIEGADGGDNTDDGNATGKAPVTHSQPTPDHSRLPPTEGAGGGDNTDAGNAADLDVHGISVRDWLKRVFGKVSDKVEKYEGTFSREGYTDTSFIAGMTDKDLGDIGVNSQHIKEFRRHIKKLTQDEPDIEITVPDNLETWLNMIGLQSYMGNFDEAFQDREEPTEAQDVFKELKAMTEDNIKDRLKITAKGHLRRLKLAITRIRDPTQREKKILTAKRGVEAKIRGQPDNDNESEQGEDREPRQVDERQELNLDPNTELFRRDQTKEEEFKQNLQRLRNSYLLTFFVVNSLWLLLMFTLAPLAQLQVFNTNPLGLIFLVTFVLVLGIQFAALFFHRAATFIQWMSPVPMLGSERACQCCQCCQSIIRRIDQSTNNRRASGATSSHSNNRYDRVSSASVSEPTPN